MSNRVIIFEGQDRCLKSTMIDRIIRTDSSHYYHTIHYGKPPKITNVQEYQEKVYSKMFEILSLSDFDIILDRSHIGEMIWSPIYRNYDSSFFIQKEERKWYNNTDKEVYLFVLVDSNIESWTKRDDLQGLNEGNIEKHMTEISHFRDSLNLTCIERKFFIDLKNWYLKDSDRIDDSALFNYIYQSML